jgi:hypothetical protein
MPLSHIKEVCIPQTSANFYLALVIGTLLFVGFVEYLNGKRIERLMAMLEEVVAQEGDGSVRCEDGVVWEETRKVEERGVK